MYHECLVVLDVSLQDIHIWSLRFQLLQLICRLLVADQSEDLVVRNSAQLLHKLKLLCV